MVRRFDRYTIFLSNNINEKLNESYIKYKCVKKNMGEQRSQVENPRFRKKVQVWCGNE